MILNDIEQNKLHDLLRQQGNLTSDGCWDTIEVFEKFLKDKRGLKPDAMSNEEIASTTPAWYSHPQRVAFKQAIKWYEKYVGKVGCYDDDE